MTRWLYLILGDVRRLRHDWVLLMSFASPLFLLIFVWVVLPWMEWGVQHVFHFSIRPHLDFIMSFLALVTPMTIGMLAGFLLLDDRDEGMLLVLAVTPMTKRGYLVYRLVLPVLLGFFFTGAFILLANLVQFDSARLLPSLLMLSLEAPLATLFLGAWAQNKVEGLAISKLMGLSFFGPVAVCFLPPQWQWAAWWLPTYWASAAFLSGLPAGQHFFVAHGMGFVIHGLWMWVAYRMFIRRVE
ncbi:MULTISPECIES: hypothetical protein [Thermoactinomyces]|jgi:fluoroquinolone transport system permease protein|uniref:Uncharacterized protein n=1 Tax=Thermoactinomyces daqus TaxID=1329516 RepID=A0A7W2AH09_9BACL|nr:MULTISPECIES: hypothetical protein [Thermoactinomyces]MBA4541695.1 hypothetical protein [Thermoactinomyces daqus]MBH8597695.1 hypothetical protein [Thermoactinomyces sp. CICC 10523]MBH8604035.1 hypothetical protein [Thermoactinomyces sp. CICC 10522]MBH8606430.1 hypothetical protein [Thermoactinomyces sp. CICC 10521]